VTVSAIFNVSELVPSSRILIFNRASPSIVDVRVDAAPSHDPFGRVGLWACAADEPAIRPVKASQPQLQVPRLVGRGHGPPAFEPLRQIVRVNRRVPIRIGRLAEIESGVLAPTPVHELDATIRQR